MSVPRPNPLLLPVSIVVGVLCGTAVFLASKVYHPPAVDTLDVEFWNLYGTPVPEVDLQTLAGERMSSWQYRGREHLVFFSSPHCAWCDTLYPSLQTAAARIPVLVVSKIDLAATKAKVVENVLTMPVAFDRMADLSDGLGVRGYPTVFWVDRGGLVRKATTGRDGCQTIIAMAVQEAIGGQ